MLINYKLKGVSIVSASALLMHLDLKRSWWAKDDLCSAKTCHVCRIWQTSATREPQSPPEMTDSKARPGQCHDAFGSEDAN